MTHDFAATWSMGVVAELSLGSPSKKGNVEKYYNHEATLTPHVAYHLTT